MQACLPALCTALPNPAEGQLDRDSMRLPKGSFAAMRASVEREGEPLIRRVPSPESQAFGIRILLDLSPTPTPGALLLFQFLKAPCHERHQLTLNKPAFCRLPHPGPLFRGPMAQSVSKNTRLGQTRAGTLALGTGSPLTVLQRASFGGPGIQFPSLEWAPSWQPLTSGPTPSEQG